jgi:hypothetical protein
VARDRFVDDVLTRGEAAEPSDEGRLPSGATHVKKRDRQGRVVIERARFKLT